MDVLEGRLRIAVAEKAADGRDGLAGLEREGRIAVPKIVQTDVAQIRLFAQLLPEPVQALGRTMPVPRSPRKDPHALSRQAVENLAGGGGQPDGPRPRLAVPQEKAPVTEIPPAQGHDFALAAAGQEQQPHGGGKHVAVMPGQRDAQAADLVAGQEAVAAAPPVARDVAARIAVLRAAAEPLRLPHDHRQDGHRPVRRGGDRPERGEPLPDVLGRDRADRPFPEAGKDLVFQVVPVDLHGAGLPKPGVAAERDLGHDLERGLGGGVRRARRVAVPERRQSGAGKRPGPFQGHRPRLPDFRPLAPPVALGVDEIRRPAGGHDPDAEAAEFGVADIADGLFGLEGVDHVLGQAAAGHGPSPGSGALANRPSARPVARARGAGSVRCVDAGAEGPCRSARPGRGIRVGGHAAGSAARPRPFGASRLATARRKREGPRAGTCGFTGVQLRRRRHAPNRRVRPWSRPPVPVAIVAKRDDSVMSCHGSGMF